MKRRILLLLQLLRKKSFVYTQEHKTIATQPRVIFKAEHKVHQYFCLSSNYECKASTHYQILQLPLQQQNLAGNKIWHFALYFTTIFFFHLTVTLIEHQWKAKNNRN